MRRVSEKSAAGKCQGHQPVGGGLAGVGRHCLVGWVHFVSSASVMEVEAEWGKGTYCDIWNLEAKPIIKYNRLASVLSLDT